MTASAAKRTVPTAPDPYTVAALLRPAHLRSVLARFCGAGEVGLTHRVERMHFARSRPLSMSLRVGLADGSQRQVLGEWIGADAMSHAAVEAERLAKARRAQLPRGQAGALLGDPATGLVLRRPGLDSRLPGLRLLHAPGLARDLAARMLGIATVGLQAKVTLRAHRLGKRSVLQIDLIGPGTRRLFVRLRPVSSSSGRQAYDRHVAVFGAARDQGLMLPAPLGFDAELGASVFSALPGRSPDLSGIGAPGAMAAATASLRRLQRAQGAAGEPYTADDEIALLADWCDRATAVFPHLTSAFRRAFDGVARALSGLSRVTPVPCHRDFHEGQVLLDGESAGILDFDTLRMGDPALDAGNLIAHLHLAALRAGQCPAAAENAVLTGMRPLPADRIVVWRQAAVLRLAAIYAFSSEPRRTVHAMIAAATG